MKKLILLPVLAVILSLTACNEKVLTIADNGKTVELKKGEGFVVQLTGNISTGNKWKITTPENDILSTAKPSEYKAEDERIGSSGTYYYYFKSNGTGTAKLQMVYGPKDNPEKKPLKTFEVTVVVN